MGPRVATAWAAAVVGVWAPFLLAGPGTLAAVRVRLRVSPSPALHLFDVQAAATPWWRRSLQLIGGVTLGCLLWRRGRAIGVVAASVALLVPASVHSGPLAGPTVRTVLRLTCCVAVVVVAVFGRHRDLLRPPGDGSVRLAPSPRRSP